MKFKQISARVLEALFNTIEEMAELSLSKKAAYRHLFLLDREYEWTETKLGKWVRDLARDGYVEIKKTNGIGSISITDKGKLKIVETISEQRNQDKKNRFISFDIPEAMRSQRNGFRSVIKRLGFRQIQQSLWVIDKDVSDLVEMAEAEYGVSEYTIYIVSQNSDADEHINKILK